MSKPILFDLFCGAGGAAMGYSRAGFEVIGLDQKPQPNYPFRFIQADAISYMEMLLDHLYPFNYCAAIHASPPCQAYTAYRRKGHGVGENYPDLIGRVRELCQATELPFVIENVGGAPLQDPIYLDGSMFGLDVLRQRLFECHGFDAQPVPTTNRKWQTPRFPAATNRAKNSRRTVEIGVWRIPLEVQQRAMGIDWMTLEELSEAIPPAYTEFIGRRLMEHLSE